ncbi:MAG TPA: alpha-1,4-glucan--maltose-1-phosphate maltosyltransferase [Thermomicrobiales bacterium]|nr:alpha-1,4-glucan--maltose-1-phosphate maltosyltransferase [Thermomicrobiales bacterium]
MSTIIAETAIAAPPSSILIEDTQPAVDGGRYAVKREVGDTLEVTADIFREGHDLIAAVVQYRQNGEEMWHEAPLTLKDNDRWHGSFPLSVIGPAEYTVLAWPDRFETWRDELRKKVAAGLEVSSELLEGFHMVEETFVRAPTGDQDTMEAMVDRARAAADQAHAAEIMLSSDLRRLVRKHAAREGAATLPAPIPVYVDRVAARFAAWYELFPRSAGTKEGQSATFRDVIDQLPRIQRMGFDVLYFTPIHPIGTTKRKGRNNTLIAQPGDPGVPYAIGSPEGGHDAIEPGLGTFDDFDALVAAAHDHGLEIALDIALQASPDHPWVREHPEWFFIRPDGSIKYAENPPKKYEDIYPLNFNSPGWRSLWDEVYRVVMVWVGHGVTSFRVDNPHTKPTAFWEWLIAKVHETNPEVIFLSEAFTRPKVMKALAKAGFAQSYTYFTWRNFKREIVEYAEELTQTEMKDFFRANFFVNTHDILPFILQEGGRPAFQFRVVLAATLSSVYGIYSGYELCENTPVPGKEEYLHSEKYEYKVWDWDREGNISDYIARLNAIRREHPALQEYDNLQFFEVQDDNLLGYVKATPDNSDIVMMMVNLDPFHAHEAWFNIPLHRLGIADDQQYVGHELLGDQSFMWTGSWQHLRLDPRENPAMIIHLKPWRHTDYVDVQY